MTNEIWLRSGLTKTKGQAGCPGCPLWETKFLFGDGGLAETVAEFLHAATHVVN